MSYNDEFGKLLSINNDGSSLYASRWTKLSQYTIVNWQLNRPPDPTRIPEIIHQLKKQDYVDGTIYLTNHNDTMVCYDGIHRIMALRKLSQTEHINHKLFIHYLPEYNEEKIRQKFETLNKCIPVPEIYTTAHQQLQEKQHIEDIVSHLMCTYPKIFKPSLRPNIPHENRDRLTDKIHLIMKDGSYDFSDMIQWLDKFNAHMIEQLNNIKLTKKQMNKCMETECYLFIRKDWHRAFLLFIREINN